MSTLVTYEEMIRRALEEGVDVTKILVVGPRWAESKPRAEGVRCALVRRDLIVRDDRSAVYLDGAMGMDSMVLADRHVNGTGPLPPWDEYVASISLFLS